MPDFTGQHSYQSTSSYKNSVDSIPTPEPSVIRDGVTAAEQMLSAIHEEISRLENRLETALRPEPPAAQSGSSGQNVASGPPRSHIAGRLAILNDGFSGAISRLRNLTSRIEV